MEVDLFQTYEQGGIIVINPPADAQIVSAEDWKRNYALFERSKHFRRDECVITSDP